MTTVFPSGLDELSNPNAGHTMATLSHREQHQNANDAIEAIQRKVGIDNSEDPASLDFRVGALEDAETGASDHGALTGLGDDDHTQYHNDARGDARYYQKGAVDAALAGKANTGHSHTIADVTNLQSTLDGKSNTGHGHAIADVSGLQAALDAKAPGSHTHTLSQITDAGTAAGLNVPATGDAAAGEVVKGNDSRLTNPRAPTAHTHPISDVTGLQSALDNKSNTGHTHAISETTGLQAALDAKESTANKGVAGGYAALDGSAKLPTANLPDIAVSDYLGAVASQVAMLALSGQKGDWCTRTDLGTTWVITGSDPSVIGGWTQLSYPTAPVTSVAGRTGAVTLTKTDVGLGNVDNTSDLSKPISTATQAALDGKSNSGHTHSITDTTGLQAALDGKSNTGHSHAISDITGLQAALDGKAATGHTHTSSQITDSTPVGRTLLTAADAPAQRTALGINQSAITFGATSPVNGTLYVTTYAPYAGTINSIQNIQTSSGTITASVRINGSNVTGLGSIAVNNTSQDVNATAANTFTAGAEISIEFSSNASATDLRGALIVTRS